MMIWHVRSAAASAERIVNIDDDQSARLVNGVDRVWLKPVARHSV